MDISIEKILKKDKNRLNNLMQLYLHELSYYFKCPFDSDTCTYTYDLFEKYFSDNVAYFIKDNNSIVGFALIDKDDNNYEISEIFILNNYKGNGYGTNAINQIFDLYKGKWEIKVVPNSKKAEDFWLKAIKEYTKGNYKLTYTGKYNRAEFSFNNKEYE